ncbi:MAG: phosphate ABC transporter substrate-binding protein [Promethearchaeota archaeon]
MKKNQLSYRVTIVFVTLFALTMTMTLGNNFAAGAEAETRTVVVDGSTTVFPIASAASDFYMDTHPDDTITVTGTGSGTGIASLIAGTVDIAMASRAMKDTEKTDLPGWNEITVAGDGIAIIVHPSNNLTQITLAQIMGIYNGTYSNWRELGGTDMDMVVINRESTSGTRGFFHDFIMNEMDFREDAYIVEKNSNGAIATEVGNTPAAVGYVGLGYLSESIKPLLVENAAKVYVEPTVQNVLDGVYPIARDLYFYTDGVPVDLAKDFIDYLLSPTGQAIIEDEGFVPVGEVGEMPISEGPTSAIPGFELWVLLPVTFGSSGLIVFFYFFKKTCGKPHDYDYDD